MKIAKKSQSLIVGTVIALALSVFIAPIQAQAAPRVTVKTGSLGSVYFGSGSSVLTASAKRTLVGWSAKLKLASAVDVIGYVQRSRSSANDLTLSFARANSVERYLQILGVKAKFTTKGASVPKSNGSAASARRAEVVITKVIPAPKPKPTVKPSVKPSPTCTPVGLNFVGRISALLNVVDPCSMPSPTPTPTCNIPTLKLHGFKPGRLNIVDPCFTPTPTPTVTPTPTPTPTPTVTPTPTPTPTDTPTPTPTPTVTPTPTPTCVPPAFKSRGAKSGKVRAINPIDPCFPPIPTPTPTPTDTPTPTPTPTDTPSPSPSPSVGTVKVSVFIQNLAAANSAIAPADYCSTRVFASLSLYAVDGSGNDTGSYVDSPETTATTVGDDCKVDLQFDKVPNGRYRAMINFRAIGHFGGPNSYLSEYKDEQGYEYDSLSTPDGVQLYAKEKFSVNSDVVYMYTTNLSFPSVSPTPTPTPTPTNTPTPSPSPTAAAGSFSFNLFLSGYSSAYPACEAANAAISLTPVQGGSGISTAQFGTLLNSSCRFILTLSDIPWGYYKLGVSVVDNDFSNLIGLGLLSNFNSLYSVNYTSFNEAVYTYDGFITITGGEGTSESLTLYATG